MALKLITPPTDEVISLQTAKDHLRIGDDEDTYLQGLINAAVAATENTCKMRFATQVWEQTYLYFPERFELDLKPVQSVDSIKYLDPDGTLTTLSEDDYQVDLDDVKGVVYATPEISAWPSTEWYTPNAVRLRYTVGYENAALIPPDLIQAILFLIGHWYVNRSPVDVAPGVVAVNIPQTFMFLVSPHREYLF